MILVLSRRAVRILLREGERYLKHKIFVCEKQTIGRRVQQTGATQTYHRRKSESQAAENYGDQEAKLLAVGSFLLVCFLFCRFLL